MVWRRGFRWVKLYKSIWILLGVFGSLSEGCGNIGTVNPSAESSLFDSTTDGVAFVMDTSVVSCCGYVSTFRYYANSAGLIRAMIWRPITTPPNYELVSLTDLPAPAAGLVALPVDPQPEVEAGDIIGWQSVGGQIMTHGTSGGSTQQQILASSNIGAEVAWTMTPNTTNSYAFGAVVTANVAPVVTGTTITIPDTQTSQSIHTVDITDDDTPDITTLDVTMTSASTEFSIAPTATGFDIETGATLTAGVYELVVTATDRCDEFSSATVTVTVQNPGPVFVPSTLDASYAGSISDSVLTDVLLYTFSVSDTDTVTCSTNNGLFEIRYNAPNQELWLIPTDASSLHHDSAPTLNVQISCSDTASNTIDSSYSVTISDELPVLTNPVATPSIGDLSPIGTSVHEFTVTDQDDVVTCTVDSPLDTVFTINAVDGVAGTQRFTIATAALLDADVTSSYSVPFTCNDLINDVTGSQAVDVTDDIPVMTGLPASSPTLNDGVQIGEVLTTIAVTDANDLADIVCSIQSPNDVLFSLTGTAPNFDISTIAGTILEESSAPYTVVVSCNDDVLTNVVTGEYTVNLLNTAPVFVGTFPTSSPDLPDSTVASISLAVFTVSDADATCSVTNPPAAIGIYEVVDVLPPANANEPEFRIQVSAAVTEADIDYDDQAVPLQLEITCTDGTTDLFGYFDVNIVDTDPVTDLPGTPFSSLSDDTTVATSVVSFAVTDSDDDISCQVVPGDPSETFFEIVNGTTQGEFWVHLKANSGLSYDVSPSITVPIQCSDGRTPDIISSSKVINIISAPPVFVNMPFTKDNVSDATDVDTVLHTFNVSDTPSSSIVCSFTAPAPYDDDFFIIDTNNPTFDIQLLAVNDLNYDVDNTILVTVTCSDGTTDISEVLTVQLYDEDPVWSTFPPDPYGPIPDTQATPEDILVFTVEDSDDTIDCNVDPASVEADSFEVIAGTPPEFTLQYKGKPPATLDSSVAASHDISVICTDLASYSRTEKVTVLLENSPPEFFNLPDTAVISESNTANTPIFAFTATDTTELDCYPTDSVASAGLHIEKGAVNLPYTEYIVYANSSEGFDFETLGPSFDVSFTCTDTESAVDGILTVSITNSEPVINNTGGSVTLPEGDTVYEILKILDIIPYDSSDTICTMADDDGGPFDVVDNRIVTVVGTLDYETQQSYTLRIECEDAQGLIATDTFIVDVENTGPEITNLPLGVSVREDQVAELLLHGLTTSEPANKCYHYENTSMPSFVNKLVPETNLWTEYYASEAVAGEPLNYEKNDSYVIFIQCKDEFEAKGTPKPLYVTVIDNETPTFTNLDDNTVQDVTAKDVNAGDTVYTITTDDAEGDDVTMTIVACEPSPACENFTLNANGDVISTSDLHEFPVDYVVLSVEIEDKYNPNAVTKDLIIEIADVNTNPEIRNIPTYDVIGILENNAPGFVPFTIDVYDPDVDDTLTTTCKFLDGGEQYFECDPDTHEIRVKSTIDYETMSQLQFDVEVSVTDSYNTTVATELLVLNINDENEPPTFTTLQWTLTKLDEGENGAVVGCPDFYNGIEDEDLLNLYEFFTFTMDCPDGEGVFQMDSLTGCVTMTREWDLDAPSKRLITDIIPCTVTATDHGGLQTRAALDIEINDEDDKIPYLDKTSYMYCVNPGSTAGTLGTVTTDDDDVDPANRDLTFDFPGGGPFAADDNTLTHGDLSDYPVGTSFETSVRVTDEGGNTDSSRVTVVICDETVTTNTNTNTNTASSSSSSSSSIDSMLLWLIPLLLLGLLLLGLLGYLLYRYCGKCAACRNLCRCCRCRTRTKPTRVIRREIIREQPVRKELVRVEPVRKTLVRTERPVTVVAKEIKEIKPVPKLATMDLKMTNFYARDLGNMGKNYQMAN